MACSAMVVMGSAGPRAASTEAWPATDITTRSAAIVPREVSTPRTRPPARSNPDNLATLNDVHPERTRRPRITPDHRVMARDAGAALDETADDRKTGVQIDDGGELLDLRGRQYFRTPRRSCEWRWPSAG